MSLTADENIVIGVRAGDLSGGVAVKTNLDQIGVSADRAEGNTNKLGSEFDRLSSIGRKLAAVLASVGAGMAFKSAIDAGVKFDQLTNRMNAATRSASMTADSLRFVREASDRLGISLIDSGNGFAGFAASALRAGLDFGQTKQIFEDVATAAASLQLPAERVALVFRALEQIAGKGTVQMEELKLQLGDSLPGAVQIAAKSMDMTTRAFMDAVEAGEVMADEFLPRFAAAIKEELGGSAETAANQLVGQTNRMKNAFTDLQDEFAKNGAGDAYTLMIKQLADVFKDPAFVAGVRAISSEIYDLTTAFIAANARLAVFLDQLSGGRISNYKQSLVNREIERQQNIQAVLERQRIVEKVNAVHHASRQGLGLSFNDFAAETIGVPATSARTETKQQIKEREKAEKASMRETVRIQKDIESAIRGTWTEQEKLNSQIEEMERLKGLSKSQEQVDQLNESIRRTQIELEEVRLKAELDGPVAKAFKSLATEIDDGFKDAFKDAFTATDGGWKKLLEGWKATFKNFLAEMAYQALARPIVLSVVSSIGGAMGLSSGAVSSVTGSGGIGSVLSSGSSMFSNLFGGSGGGISSFINGIGGSLGFYNPIPAAGMMGPVAPTGLFGSTTLSGALGAGAIGGGLASILGLGSGNMIVDTGLGFAGTALGTLVGGPIGAGIGSFLGTALGGVFGKSKPKRETTATSIRLGADGKFEVYSGSGTQASQDWGSEIGAILDAFLKATGGTVYGGLGSIQTNTATRDPGTFYNATRLSNTPGDTDAVIRHLLTAQGIGVISGGNDQLKDVLRRSAGMGSSSEQLMADLQFAREVFGIAEDIDPLADALAELDKQFETLRKRAEDLGLPMDKVNELYAKQKDAMEGAIKAQMAGFSSLQQMIASFEAFLKGQQLGADSSLSPMGKFNLAQESYDNLLNKAQGGDLTVTQDLLSAAAQLLSIGRGVYASSQAFADLEALVRQDIKEIAKAAGVPGYASGVESSLGGFRRVGETGTELVNFPQGSRVYSAGDTAGIMALSGNVAIDNVRTNAQLVAILSEILEVLQLSATQQRAQTKKLDALHAKAVVNA